MKVLWVCLFIALIVSEIIPSTLSVQNSPATTSKDNTYGYVDVRAGAHMFYWLYYTKAPVRYTDRPLVIWLQGGPGASSCGHGNFEEIGPLDVNLAERNFTWVKDMNVLFIDSPVGSGFSFVDNLKLLTTDNKQISDDLMAFMRAFMTKHSEFQTVPLYIFSESYGGKMAAEFALDYSKGIEEGSIISNLKSVVFGDPWISPIDSMLSWAPFLFNNVSGLLVNYIIGNDELFKFQGAVDRKGFFAVQSATLQTQDAFQQGRFKEATMLWGHTENIIRQYTYGIDFYNILKRTPYFPKSRGTQRILFTMIDYDLDEARLARLMNGKVKSSLNLAKNVEWGGQRSETFNALTEDFLKPATDTGDLVGIDNDLKLSHFQVFLSVERLLNETSLNVIVITGQQDLIVATPGTVNWVDKLRWTKRNEYLTVERKAFIVNGFHEGYSKSVDRFSMFWVNRAGHMVPADNPAAMAHILKKIINIQGSK